MKRKAKQKVVSASEKRRSWLVPSFIFSAIVIIAVAAIWQKSRDPSQGNPDLVAEVGLMTEEGIRTARTVAELDRIRSSLQAQYSVADAASRVRLLNLRIATAERGLEIAKPKAQRKSFQLEQLRMWLVLCWAERNDEPFPVKNVRRLQELANLFLDDADQELSLEAHRCHLMLAGSHLLRDPASPEAATDFKNAIELITARFSDDEDTVSDIRLVLGDLLQDKHTGLEVFDLMRFISEKYKHSNQGSIRDWSVTLMDQTLFAECDFLYKVSLCEQGVELAYEATLDSVPWLLSKNLSPFGIQRFLLVANVYESKSRFDLAKRVYRIILDWMDATDTRPAVEEIRIACNLGIRRVESVGKPFRFEGVDVENNPIKSNESSGKIVLVLFVGDAKEIAAAMTRIVELSSLEKHGMKILVVGLGFGPAELQEAIGKSNGSFVSWIADKDRSGSLITQCPAVILPYGMIVDRNGKVARLAVYGDGLQQALESMIFDR